MAKASGLTSITLLMAGPCLSIWSMRARYFSAMERALNLPDAIPACKSAIVVSSRSKGWISGIDVRLAAWRALARAGNAAALAVTRALVRRKLRRGREMESVLASSFWLKRGLRFGWFGVGERNYRLAASQTCQR